ncbi:hypothetical protein [Phaeocystidibacter luteus]|uniref:Glycosyltransferase RgtA/B/C/D-like domain-containing protein n=1 Tax=Phaeocystidibacter luteus TaxID=911197 RepID=A0A6N6RG41_9FLAO|nr:hypothetical protein [Phaeocystidibacter luteus]KAB2808728.1 hypothetical protein F8C67_10600 [Phaeocystidibacter luteus]
MFKANKILFSLSTLLLGIVYCRLIYLQEAIVDGSDGLLHYQFARFMFDHPENAFNHWAKPLFTLIMSVPAQGGFHFLQLSNALLVLVSGGLIYASANVLKLKFAPLAPLFLGLGNSVTYVILGGLTEPLFIFVFSWIIYATVKQRWMLLYILLGASWFVRPEAIVLIPVFGIYGIVKGARKEVLWGLLVPALYTIVGVVLLDLDWTWIVTDQPYETKSGYYGEGNLFYFIERWNQITPYVTLVLAFLASYRIFSRRDYRMGMIFLSGFGIIFLHSFLWAYGLRGSAGLLRILTTSLPALALLCVYALSKNGIWPKVTTSVAMIVLLLQFYFLNTFPKPVFYQEFGVRELVAHLEEKGAIEQNTRVVAQYAAIAFLLDLDPFDEERFLKMWNVNPQNPAATLKNGDLIIWEDIVANREGNMPFSALNTCADLHQIDSIYVKPADIAIVTFRVEK